MSSFPRNIHTAWVGFKSVSHKWCHTHLFTYLLDQQWVFSKQAFPLIDNRCDSEWFYNASFHSYSLLQIVVFSLSTYYYKFVILLLSVTFTYKLVVLLQVVVLHFPLFAISGFSSFHYNHNHTTHWWFTIFHTWLYNKWSYPYVFSTSFWVLTSRT